MFNIPRRFAGIKRFEQIAGVLSRHGLDFVLEKSGIKKKRLFTKEYISRPVELRLVLEELGGSFIKLGQFLSLRPDLLPKEYCEELTKLQDDVEGIPYSEVAYMIKSEFKTPVDKLFKEFDHNYIAAASIGQVHAAKIKGRPPKKVAVKVMRPGIKSTFETDLDIIDYFARHLKHHFNPKVFDPEEIAGEFRKYTEGELDYLREAKSIKLFEKTMAGDSNVVIPKVYDYYTSRRILTMEFLDGVKLSDVIREPGKYKKLNRTLIARHLAESFLKQIFIDGVFHADPHPGNILVMKSKLGLLDFGIVGRVDEEMRDKLGNLLISLVERDPDGIVSALISLNLVDATIDTFHLKEDILDELGEYYDVSLDKMDLAEVLFKCIHLAKHYDIRIPRDFVLLAKCLITLKGVCAELNPKFNIVMQCRPFIAKMIKDKSKPTHIFKRLMEGSRRFAAFIKEIPEQTRKFYSLMNKADSALDNINKDLFVLTSEVRRESIRIILGVLIAALIISSSFSLAISPALSKAFLIMAAAALAYLFFSIFSDNFFRRKAL